MTLIRSIVVLLTIIILKDGYNAKVHTFGYGQYDNQYFHREVINSNASGIKNYVVIFNFEGGGFKEVTYVAIGVMNANNSDAVIKVSGTNVNAKINIYSGQNVKATISVHGESDMPYGYLKVFQDMENVKSKSITFVYVKNALPSIAPKEFAQNSIGIRRKGDQLIYFETRNVTNFSRFPSRVMNYAGNGKEYITYVGFSFNSPTAMTLVNTTFVEEQEFNAVVYDMNTEHFMVNMSVYAIVSYTRPNEFLGVIAKNAVITKFL